jgi:hypothetical protein
MQCALKQAGKCLQRSCRYEWSTVLAAKLNWHCATSHNWQAEHLFAISHAASQSRRSPHALGNAITKPNPSSVRRSQRPSAVSSLERTVFSTTSVKIKPPDTPYTISNAISLLRLLSAPGIAWLIAAEQWECALAAVALAGSH